MVIDDVCESHGCLDNLGNRIGSNSLGATFSTYFGHHLTSVEGGFVSTCDKKLYDLMKMKRSHGMARESSNFDYYAKKYTNIDKSFLFITDGYNFRNTEIGAVLGLSQLKKLDKSIEIRNKNFKRFCTIMDKYNKLFHPVDFSYTSSNFCLPFVAKSKNTKLILQEKFQEENIEYRPIVSGNLLKQPFLKGYEICTDKKTTNADLIHNNGLYIGNSQFVNTKHLDKLENILESL
jgi:CDP-6-deoxy-D-xylo-4-hexulose-3-dehydrase